MNENFHFVEKNEIKSPPRHEFRYETQNAIVDFSGCSWNFYILSKLGDSLSSTLTKTAIKQKKIFGRVRPPPHHFRMFIFAVFVGVELRESPSFDRM